MPRPVHPVRRVCQDLEHRALRHFVHQPIDWIWKSDSRERFSWTVSAAPLCREIAASEVPASVAEAVRLVTIFTPILPWGHIGDENMLNVNGRPIPFDTAIARNIDPGSTAGLPGLVLPAGLTPGGLPVALEFDGPAGSDRALLSVGMSLERALGALPAPRI